MKQLISPDTAKALIAQHLNPIPSISCPLNKCANRVLRQTVVADRPFPPFNRSMMDGFAIRAKDIDEQGVFQIAIQMPAGSPARNIGTGKAHCAEIMTGAVVPDDADCVVPYELTKRIDSNTMQLLQPTKHHTGDCIHAYASDRPEGETLLQPGIQIGSREVAVAASCGYNELQVSKIPAIAIVSTGDELVNVASQPEAHQIRRSNDIAIETALAGVHLYAQECAHLPDDANISKKQLQSLIETNDIVIISGGISMGKKDYIPGALDELGLSGHFHGIAQKPGKPMGFWSNAQCAVFTLPGNPSSTLTCLHHYVIPALFRAMGQTELSPPQSVAIDAPIKARDDLTTFSPVKISQGNQASPRPTNNSGDLVRILDSDGYIEVTPTKDKTYPVGTTFEFYPWH
ncbi:MAG: molybdopterin molybdotransferase MoeA [Opitutales bacterium]|jgi:molybdopterin molybdotransferase|nr:molybdopterin molybdotransferase MoeA [Opitutales bacterium]MDP4645263.1 molybdopterin molybdotransferase MoeA [Opitutales bacterium]MDP4777337.1 molybdopterin molybdotransferase MoeA [Opitutales bacterium]MDP4879855.1 molybdopterin molybdotransferase MoeA [Opitutales bacterium]MDP4883607.1 molybdopterin molybdotransferase MoeA [Opitutales bacterium]